MKDKLFALMKNNDVDIDFDTFLYGYEIFKQYFLFFMFVIPISIFFNTCYESIVFLFFLILIRRYNGGFHFDNKYYCLIGSIIITIVFSKLSKEISFSLVQYLLCMCLSIGVTFILGVVDNHNKKISDKEKKIYLKYCLIIEVIYCFLIVIFKITDNESLANIILLVLVFNGLNAIIGKIHQSIVAKHKIFYK